MARTIKGGYNSYGQLAGVLMLGSTTPRAPGDLGHALSFDFPVRYGAALEFPFADLISGEKQHLSLAIEAVNNVGCQGVRFVAADCGLFSVFHREINEQSGVPFLSSSLMLIPLLKRLYQGREIGVLTGDTRILKDFHLQPVGASLADIVMEGMEESREFQRVVIEHGDDLNITSLGEDTLEAGRRLKGNCPAIAAIILECTNLISFKRSLQEELGLPVYDMLSLVKLAADGFLFPEFRERFI